MRVRQLDHVNLTVRDFDESVAWYGRVFAFEKVEEGVQDGTRWGVIRGGDAMLCIYEYAEREHLDRDASKGRGLHGLSHFALRIDDADEWLATAARENIEIKYGGVIEWPHSRSWYIDDPTGWEIEVVHWNDGTIRFEPLPEAPA